MRPFLLPFTTLFFRLHPEPFLSFRMRVLRDPCPRVLGDPAVPQVYPHLPLCSFGGCTAAQFQYLYGFGVKRGLTLCFQKFSLNLLALKRSENKPSFVFGVALESDLEMV